MFATNIKVLNTPLHKRPTQHQLAKYDEKFNKSIRTAEFVSIQTVFLLTSSHEAFKECTPNKLFILAFLKTKVSVFNIILTISRCEFVKLDLKNNPLSTNYPFSLYFVCVYF